MPPPPSSTLPAMWSGNLWFGTLSEATGRSSLRSESDWGVGLPMAKAGVAGVIHTPPRPCAGLSHLENCSQGEILRQGQGVKDLQPELCSRLGFCMSWQDLFGILGCPFCFVSFKMVVKFYSSLTLAENVPWVSASPLLTLILPPLHSYGGGSFSFANLIQGVTRRFSTEYELQQVRTRLVPSQVLFVPVEGGGVRSQNKDQIERLCKY